MFPCRHDGDSSPGGRRPQSSSHAGTLTLARRLDCPCLLSSAIPAAVPKPYVSSITGEPPCSSTTASRTSTPRHTASPCSSVIGSSVLDRRRRGIRRQGPRLLLVLRLLQRRPPVLHRAHHPALHRSDMPSFLPLAPLPLSVVLGFVWWCTEVWFDSVVVLFPLHYYHQKHPVNLIG